MNALTEQSLSEFILERVTAHWNERGSPIILSKLGQDAIAQNFNLRDILQGRKLKQFIEEELSDSLILEPDPSAPTLTRARPIRGQSAGSALGNATPAKVNADSTAKGATLRLHKVLWMAFSRPLEDGFERRIQTEPFIRFWDAPAPLSDIAGRYPIARSYIAGPAETLRPRVRAEVVLENIRLWMKEMKLDIDDFGEGKMAGQKPRITTSNPLLLFVSALNSEEMKRINIPLDIVAKLLKI